MEEAFNKIRKRLQENEKLFLCFLLLFLVLSLWFILDTFYIHITKAGKSQVGSYISLPALASCFFGYLNYRTKIGVHDMLVAKYNEPPPPPKQTIMNNIEKNTKFNPIKIKP